MMRAALHRAIACAALAIVPLLLAPAGRAADSGATSLSPHATAPRADTSRIVAIGGAVTEILFALGLGDRVVAVDQTSRYPAAARARPDVGYSRP